MTILGNMIDRRPRRSGSNPTLNQEGGHYNYWDMKSISGTDVTDAKALSLTTFYRGISLIASTVAGLPLHIHREVVDPKTGKTIARKDQTPRNYYLWGRPNIEQTFHTMWEKAIADELRGNAFLWVDENDIGDPTAVWRINRHNVAVGRTRSGQKVYDVITDNGRVAMIDYKEGGEIIHIPNWGDSLVGYDPIKLASEAIALGLSAEEFASRFFSQDAVPPGYLSTQEVLDPEESDKVSDRWMRRVTGSRNWRRIPVLSNGVEFKALSTDPEKAQMQSLRLFQGEEICRLLGIPPHMLGFTEKVTSWGQGIAEQGRGFVTFTLQAHINRFEQAIDDCLLVRELTKRYAKFDTGGLLRGTTLQRYQAYALGYGRWLTPNDIRDDEDLPPIDGGDVLPAASNLIPIDQLGSNFREEPRQIGAPQEPEESE